MHFLIWLLCSYMSGTWWSYQVRIGPVAFQSSRHFGDDEVIHLLSGLWMISVEGTQGRLNKNNFYFLEK